MAAKLPYMVSPGLIPKIFGKIQEARRPERFTQDYLETKLGFPGGSARAIIPLLKRLSFLSSDGVPTERYDQFRNETTQGSAIADAMRDGFKEIFDRNEYAGDLSKDKLQSLVLEITGLEKDNRVVQCVVSTFFALKEFADFETPQMARAAAEPEAPESAAAPAPQSQQLLASGAETVGMNFSYTINLNLPETTNPEVFNAIFRALRENLLKR